MLKYTISIFCVLIYVMIPGFAQHSFIWNTTNSFYYIVEKDPQQFYFIGAFNNDFDNLIHDSAIVKKWNFSNDTLVEFYQPDTNYYSHGGFEIAIPNSENGIVAIGHSEHKSSQDTNYVWIVGIDSLLNKTWEVNYPFARKQLFFSNVVRLNNGNWITALNTLNMAWVVHEQYFLIEFTESGQINHIIPADTFGYVDYVSVHPVTGSIYCYGYFANSHQPSNTWIRVFDTVYNQIGFKPVFPDNSQNKLWPPFGGHWLNEDTMLFIGRKSYYNATPQDEDICIYKMKENDSIIPVKEKCYRRPGTTDYTTANNFCITKDNKIIQIGDLNVPFWENAWIGCYDMDFNPLYHRIFYSDTLRNMALAVFACSDSGFFVLKSSATTFFYPTDAKYQILKFDKYGNLPGMDIFDKVKIQKHLLYPNPGKNYFIIEISTDLLQKKPCLLELFDVTGNLSYRWNFDGNRAQINTNELPKGFYFYRITQGQQPIITGKWIKS